MTQCILLWDRRSRTGLHILMSHYPKVHLCFAKYFVFLLQVGECKFSKLDTIDKDGITYLVLPMGALCNEGQLKSVVWFDFCDSGQFLSDLTLGDESAIGIINLLGALINFMDCVCFPDKLYVQSSCLK